MNSVYHSGELKVQARAGTGEAAISVSRIVYSVIAHVFVDFIQSQPIVILSSVDSDGMAWASILCGPLGFMQVVDEHTLRVATLPDASDPLYGNLHDSAQVGLLVIDFSTHRRLRLNGCVVTGADGFTVLTRQVYANCPRYIQSRRCGLNSDASPSPRVTLQATSLNGELQRRIRLADTFFLASFHPVGGSDVSHRGGFPGFVQVLDERTLVWPDYNGNGMFNTLGNISENPNAGLLFLDFEQGGALKLSGTAEIIWDTERAELFPGAERIIEFNILKVIVTENSTPLRCTFVEYSPYNPWFC
ncbi:MAG: pyridoxamine 5'-phosphate oxidase family protein [Desulfuromonadales bacterium]|nr:pyridoxamine 5'-phosphate oxidase family protein [Desulfuromonadales bacterium]